MWIYEGRETLISWSQVPGVKNCSLTIEFSQYKCMSYVDQTRTIETVTGFSPIWYESSQDMNVRDTPLISGLLHWGIVPLRSNSHITIPWVTQIRLLLLRLWRGSHRFYTRVTWITIQPIRLWLSCHLSETSLLTMWNFGALAMSINILFSEVNLYDVLI